MSATPQTANTPSLPTTPQKSQRCAQPSSPSVSGVSLSSPKGTEYSATALSSVSDSASTNVAAAIAASDHPLQSVLASCQPSLVHLLPERSGLDIKGHMCVSANRSVYRRCGLQAPQGCETRTGKNHWDARTCFDSKPESINLAMSSHSAAACRLCRICMLTLTGCRTSTDVEGGHWALSAMCVRSSRLWIWMASIGSCF